MLTGYRLDAGRLVPMASDEDLSAALWIDLLRPDAAEAARAAAYGPEIPSLAEMEEIEISNRLYREERADYMTVALVGQSESRSPVTGPVTFILTHRRLVTVRHHAPRPFETYPPRANKTGAGCGNPERVFLGLVEEAVSRIADLMEGAGRELDEIARLVFGGGGAARRPDVLQGALERIGRVGELLGRLGLSLLSIDRALSFFDQLLEARPDQARLHEIVQGQVRDIHALDVHADFLSNRIGLTSDATLGLINLTQGVTVRMLSVVAALFLPPTLIASVYGMNFARMPELDAAWGYPAVLVLMLASAAASYFYFKWKGWL